MKRSVFFLLLFFSFFSCYANNSWRSIQLTEQQLRDLESLSHTYGAIRYFYPSQILQSFDWDRFLVHSVNQILANEDEDIALLLHRLFAPICPEIVFEHEPITCIEATIQAPFYIQEHRGIGSIATLFHGRNYTPITLISNSENYPQFYRVKLQDDLYMIFPLALKKQPTKTSEHRKLESELRNIQFRGFRLIHAFSGNRRANADILINCYAYRIADMIVRWQIIRNFYPYYEEANLPHTWDKLCIEAVRSVAACTSIHHHHLILWRLFSNIHDSHVHMWPQFFYSSRRVIFGVVEPVGQFYPEIRVGFAGSWYIADAGAYANKLKRGDIIKAINDTPIDEFVESRLQRISSSTRASGLNMLGRGGALFRSYALGAEVTLLAEKVDGSTEEVVITTNRREPFRSSDDRFIEKFDCGIIYMNACSHSATYENFSARISDFQQARGIIIDVRGHPHFDIIPILSHFITDSVSMGNLLIPVISFPNRKNIRYEEAERWKIAPATSYFSRDFSRRFEYKKPLPIAIDVPVVFLTDASAMSFAESIMDIVKHYQIGTIIGEPTAGCNGDATRIDRPFATFFFTLFKFTNRDGSPHYGVGVLPDIYSVPLISDIRAGIDTQLERAKTYFYEKWNN